MTMKKIARLITVFLLILSACLTASCGGTTNGTENTTTTTQVTTTTTTAPPKPDTPRVFSSWVSALFGGGPFVTGIRSNAEELKASGFNTIIIWSVHVQENGDLVLNDIPVVSNGKLTRAAGTLYSKGWKSLREGETSIERIELSVGAWGCSDFENIRSLIQRDGTGKDTILYKNFQVLIEAADADAINFDDESCYDIASATKFGKMCDDMGVKVALCPYTRQDFWKTLAKNLGDIVDRIYVQCYAGGAGNNPADWAALFGTKVIPGYWCLHGGEGDSAKTVSDKLTACGDSITGGFMWYFDDMQHLSGSNSTDKYADAINKVNPDEK